MRVSKPSICFRSRLSDRSARNSPWRGLFIKLSERERGGRGKINFIKLLRGYFESIRSIDCAKLLIQCGQLIFIQDSEVTFIKGKERLEIGRRDEKERGYNIKNGLHKWVSCCHLSAEDRTDERECRFSVTDGSSTSFPDAKQRRTAHITIIILF